MPHRESKGVRSRFDGKDGIERRARRLEWLDVPDFGVDSLGFVLAALLGVVVLVLLGGPIVLIGLDLAWLVGAFGVGAFARFILRHPWRVEAHDGTRRYAWDVQGYRAAGRARNRIKQQLADNVEPQHIRPVERTST